MQGILMEQEMEKELDQEQGALSGVDCTPLGEWVVTVAEQE